jgi:hypothetical protein
VRRPCRSCPTHRWRGKDLSAVDQRPLTETLVDKIVIERHPSKIDKGGRCHYLIRAIPFQDPQQEAERLRAVHEARVKIVPRAEQQVGRRGRTPLNLIMQPRTFPWSLTTRTIAVMTKH